MKNRPITYLAGAKIPWATIFYNESKHNILDLVGKANKGEKFFGTNKEWQPCSVHTQLEKKDTNQKMKVKLGFKSVCVCVCHKT
jgi:hypothetical protein